MSNACPLQSKSPTTIELLGSSQQTRPQKAWHMVLPDCCTDIIKAALRCERGELAWFSANEDSAPGQARKRCCHTSSFCFFCLGFLGLSLHWKLDFWGLLCFCICKLFSFLVVQRSSPRHMDAGGFGSQTGADPPRRPSESPEKQTVGTMTASHKILTLQALSSSLNSGTTKRGCLG